MLRIFVDRICVTSSLIHMRVLVYSRLQACKVLIRLDGLLRTHLNVLLLTVLLCIINFFCSSEQIVCSISYILQNKKNLFIYLPVSCILVTNTAGYSTYVSPHGNLERLKCR